MYAMDAFPRRGCVLRLGLLLAAALSPALATAQTQPVTVTITRVEQIGDDFDSTTLGDFYARVTIDGTTLDTFDSAFDFPPPTGFLVPTGWLTPPAPWVLTRQVPFGLDSVPVTIELLDDDFPDANDLADLNPGSKDAIDLEVDLSTGRWTGDLTWPQACVSGPEDLTGLSAGLCFDVSVLSAGGDADGDTLLDGWEINGYNDDKDEIVDVDLPQLGADALREDVFVELDALVAANHTHVLLGSALTSAVQTFAQAPRPNPDGTTGVQLHLDVGAAYGAGFLTVVPGTGGVTGTWGDLGGGEQIPEAGNEILRAFTTQTADGTAFFDLERDHFDPPRRSIFRYGISGHQTNASFLTNDCTSGGAYQIPGGYFFVTLGGFERTAVLCWGADGNNLSVGTGMEQAGTLLHELGHTLGLLHGGVPDEIHEKPHFLSVMNYAFQMCTVPKSPDGRVPGACDYSRFELDTLDETSLDECRGIDGGSLGFGKNDFNHNNLIEGSSSCEGNPSDAVADVNRDGICIRPGMNGTLQSTPGGDDLVKDDTLITNGFDRSCNTPLIVDDVAVTAIGATPTQPNVLVGHDDWSNLSFNLFGGGGASGSAAREADPRTVQEARDHLGNLLAPAVAMTKSGPSTGRPGDTLSYTLELRNPGFGPALGAVLSDSQPTGGPLVSDVGALVVGSVVTRTSTFSVPLDACPGDFTSVTSSLTFEDFGSRELTASSSAPLQILDVAAPSLSLRASPDVLWSPNHKLVDVAVAVTVEDDCDPNPTVALVSISSNEAESGFLGQGNGDPAPDVVGAAFGSDDRAFLLRAERGTRGDSTGRVYSILYRVTDGSGNSTDETVSVTVATSNSDQ